MFERILKKEEEGLLEYFDFERACTFKALKDYPLTEELETILFTLKEAEEVIGGNVEIYNLVLDVLNIVISVQKERSKRREILDDLRIKMIEEDKRMPVDEKKGALNQLFRSIVSGALCAQVNLINDDELLQKEIFLAKRRKSFSLEKTDKERVILQVTIEIAEKCLKSEWDF